MTYCGQYTCPDALFIEKDYLFVPSCPLVLFPPCLRRRAKANRNRRVYETGMDLNEKFYQKRMKTSTKRKGLASNFFKLNLGQSLAQIKSCKRETWRRQCFNSMYQHEVVEHRAKPHWNGLYNLRQLHYHIAIP